VGEGRGLEEWVGLLGKGFAGGGLIGLGLGFLDTTRAGSFANLDRSPPDVKHPIMTGHSEQR